MRQNNFDFLRFIFAIFIIISHSYPLSGNDVNNQWFFKFTGYQLELSHIGVNGFFILSGYLIFQSLERSNNIFDFYWRRILRLFPALFVMLSLTILLAPYVYQNSISYFNNPEVLTYIPRNLSLFRLQYGIDGIFENNPYRFAINGSLWTICYEFSFYILLSFLLVIIAKKQLVLLFLFTLYIVAIVTYNLFNIQLSGIFKFGISGLHFSNLGIFFMSGTILALIKIENFKYKKILLMIILIVLVALFYLKAYQMFKHIFLPLLILLTGLMPVKHVSSFGKMGDPSYGIYIYGFPIQQTLMYFFNFNLISLLITSIFISIIFGYLSWHFIEKKALFYKNFIKETNLYNKC